MGEKDASSEKIKVNGYLREDLWNRFLERVFEEHGRTSGGAISSTLEDAISLYLEQGGEQNRKE